MDCERVNEILPWFLNGSLDASERHAAVEHLAQCNNCRKELQQAAFAGAVHQQHISEQILVDYAYDQLSQPSDVEIVDQHLAFCNDCSEQLGLVNESRQLMDADENVVSFHQQAPLQETRSLRGWQYAAMAAGIVGIIALGALWRSSRQVGNMNEQQVALNRRIEALETDNERLRRAGLQPIEQLEQAKKEIEDLKTRMKDISAPQANIPVIEIFPQELAERGSTQPIQQVQIPRDTKSLTLILNSQAIYGGKNLTLEILDSVGNVVWQQDGFVRHKTSDYTLNIPADLLSTGNYTLNVYGTAGKNRRKIETYRIKVDKATG
jgi:hypothetical protein